MNAIQTEYKGYLFRSRLEARWAVFLDTLGIKWQYEAQGYEIDSYRYLPDFWLPESEQWIEVKGDPEGLREEFNRMRVVLGPNSPLPQFASGKRGLIVLGDIPLPSYGAVQLHPVLTRASGILQRTWGFFASLNRGGAQFISDGQQSGLYMLFGKYAFTDPCSSKESPAWKVETWTLDTPGGFEQVNEAYKAARQARFEHGASGR